MPELRGLLPFSITLAVAMMIDSMVRYSHRLGEHPFPFGFYEWLLRR